jgi:hypothetical protein
LIEVNRSRSAAAGFDVFLYDHLTEGVTTFDDWRARFEAEVNRFADRGVEANVKGLSATASGTFAIAALCFHYAACVPGGDRIMIGGPLQRAMR